MVHESEPPVNRKGHNMAQHSSSLLKLQSRPLLQHVPLSAWRVSETSTTKSLAKVEIRQNSRQQAQEGKLSWSVSWCSEPSQPQRITSGLKTNFTLSPSYSFHKSSYHKSCCFFLPYLYSADTQHGNLHPAGWPILYCGPTQEPVLATAYTGKNRERFQKKCGWMDWKGRNKQGRNPWQ